MSAWLFFVLAAINALLGCANLAASRSGYMRTAHLVTACAAFCASAGAGVTALAFLLGVLR